MNDKLVFRIVTAVSVFVFLVVIILNRKLITPPPAPFPY
jgi:putative membrane protein